MPRIISKNAYLSDFDQYVHSIFNRAKLFKLTSEEIQNIITDEIYLPMNHKYPSGRAKFSNYLKGYVFGLISANRAALWAELEFIYILDNVKYSTAKESTHKLTEELYKANRGCELSDVDGHFYWKNSDKIYF